MFSPAGFKIISISCEKWTYLNEMFWINITSRWQKLGTILEKKVHQKNEFQKMLIIKVDDIINPLVFNDFFFRSIERIFNVGKWLWKLEFAQLQDFAVT